MGCTTCSQPENKYAQLCKSRNIGIEKDTTKGTVNCLELNYAATTMRGTFLFKVRLETLQ